VQEAFQAEGGSVPLEHHWLWLRDVNRTKQWYVTAPDGSGSRVLAAVPVERLATRSLPGHYRLRVTRFGHAFDNAEVAGVLEALRHLVDREGRLLSVNVEVFTPDDARREQIGELADRQGYEPVRGGRQYRWTGRIDLSASESELMAGFTRSCRRAIRETERKGLRIDDVLDADWAPRMMALWHETFERTGAKPPPRDWARRVAFARARPDLYRIVGTFAPGHAPQESLVAFACGMNNGAYAVYSDGASTKDTNASTPLSYAPLWDLIRWARREGCGWFDMGGIARSGSGPTGGIADFKRRFTDDVIEVGSEWAYTPSTLRSWLSDRARRWGQSMLSHLDRAQT
jgi:hypothetical protein